ncbi:MAG: type II toxin-antitoxin system HicA family toxin [archaeon]
MHKQISGKECIKILCNKFSFKAVRQKGSHVVLKKEHFNGVVGTVVPLHDTLKTGTLKSILALAKIDEEEFFKYM